MMKIGKIFAIGLLICATLAGCGKKGANSTETFQDYFNLDPNTLDFGKATFEEDLKLGANFIEPLVETNAYGDYLPAAASEIPTTENGGISEDGLTWTFKIRKGVKWVTSEGEVYGEETAGDYVFALKHAADVKAEFAHFSADVIAGYKDYLDGTTTDFSTVGVKAVDDHTLQFTLATPTPYFISLLTTGPYFPVNEKFATEKGADYGKIAADDILYSGPYILDAFSSKSVIELKANDEYWDLKNVHVKHVKLSYSESVESDQAYENFKNGNLTCAVLKPAENYFKNVEKEYKDNIFIANPSAFTAFGKFNLNRAAYEFSTAEHDNASTKAALLNKNFRLAILRGWDRTAYLTMINTKKYADASIRNEMTPSDFVSVNGGTYAEAVAAHAPEEGDSGWKGVSFADGVDDFHDVKIAKAYLAKAKAELGDSVKWPIHLDLAVGSKAENRINRVKSFKASIEAALGKDNVVLDINLGNEDQVGTATYAATTGAQSDFDMDFSYGWGSSFQDPSAYLNIYNAKSGSLLAGLGLDPFAGEPKSDPQFEVKKTVGLYEYTDLLEKAGAITDVNDLNARDDAYAKAEAYLVGNALILPYQNMGSEIMLSHIKPGTQPLAHSGTSGERYKFIELQKAAIKNADFVKFQKEREARGK
ncbi:MAG: ABC transporter substrate-binding protein [Lactobacillales bacterium]|jgi:oligopeptide transport system substrate-binding protein|nr:ABC transporter substrate-binding protein [Lactobacillales bacterium]